MKSCWSLTNSKTDYHIARLDAWFHVVAREESGVSIHHSFPPSIIVLLHDVDYGALVKRQFVVFVLYVTVDCDNCAQD